MFLVDANVLSEATKPSPNHRVVEWLRDNERELVVDPFIVGDIRYGILLLPKGGRRSRLERWFELGIARLHCLAWDVESGVQWASLVARLKVSGKAMPIKDSLIAATALLHGLTVATRNASDFKKAGVPVVNPFTV
jgi:predicted nucleic acid-binding protein